VPRSICAVLVLVVVGLLSIVASPAWACGCGAYIPDRAGAAVVDERAAWVMPVPSAAQVAPHP
jgi:hypothetical protein